MKRHKLFLLFAFSLSLNFSFSQKNEKEEHQHPYLIYQYGKKIQPNDNLRINVQSTGGVIDSMYFRLNINNNANSLIIGFLENRLLVNTTSNPVKISFRELFILNAKKATYTQNPLNSVRLSFYYEKSLNISKLIMQDSLVGNMYKDTNYVNKMNLTNKTQGSYADISEALNFFKALNTDSLEFFILISIESKKYQESIYGGAYFRILKKDTSRNTNLLGHLALPIISSTEINSDSIKKDKFIIYEQNKVKLEEQIKSIDHNIDKLISDPDYSKIDFKKIGDIKMYFKDIDQNINKASTEEIVSTNYLMNDFTSSLKVMKRKRKFKKDKMFYIKYNNLFVNIKALHSFIYAGNHIGACGNRKGYPVEVHAISGKDSVDHKEVQKLRVNYCYFYGLDFKSEKKEPMISFSRLTSPSCENVSTGKYYFWLTDESTKEVKVCSHYQRLDMSEEKNLNKDIPIILDIIVLNKNGK